MQPESAPMDRRRASPDRARDLQHERHSGTQAAAVADAAAGPNASGTTVAAALLELTAQPAYQAATQLVGALSAVVQSNDAHLGSLFSPKPYPAPVLPSASARGPLSPSSRLGSASGALPPLLQGWGSPVRGPGDPSGNPSQPQGWGSPVRGASAIDGTATYAGGPALPQGWASPTGAAHSRAPALPGWGPAHAGGWLSPPALLSPPAGSLHPALLVRAAFLDHMAERPAPASAHLEAWHFSACRGMIRSCPGAGRQRVVPTLARAAQPVSGRAPAIRRAAAARGRPAVAGGSRHRQSQACRGRSSQGARH